MMIFHHSKKEMEERKKEPTEWRKSIDIVLSIRNNEHYNLINKCNLEYMSFIRYNFRINLLFSI